MNKNPNDTELKWMERAIALMKLAKQEKAANGIKTDIYQNEEEKTTQTRLQPKTLPKANKNSSFCYISLSLSLIVIKKTQT